MFPTILIVDDEPSIVQSLSGLLADEGFEVATAANGYEALQQIDAHAPDLVLLDIWMPGLDGLETLKEIKKSNPRIHVVMITGHGTIETAVQATKLGAFDFIEKPLAFEKVIVAINNALNFRRLEEENRYLRKKTIEKHSITGNSDAVNTLMDNIGMVAPTDSWVLIKGENGTGKELVARTIHNFSQRATNAMIDVNCAAIPDELIESELFGHEKGAFAGANSKKIGKFELAQGGTIFLDEIGEISSEAQLKLLRILQSHSFERLGSEQTIQVNIRILAATNRDLMQEVKNGNFREDLYYRLNVIPVNLPPLSRRINDIPLLAKHFLNRFAAQQGKQVSDFNSEAMRMLLDYLWPGNVRELENTIEHAVVLSKEKNITVSDLPKTIVGTSAQKTPVKHSIAANEVELIRDVLDECSWNKTAAAYKLGISRSTLYEKIKKYQISKPTLH